MSGFVRQRISNTVWIEVTGADLTTFGNIEVYVRQGCRFMETFVPNVVSSSEMYIEIPYEKAMSLEDGCVSMQFAYTDAGGNPHASDEIRVDVAKLINPDGYCPPADNAADVGPTEQTGR